MNIIRVNQLVKKVGLSRTTIWRLEKQGKMPKRIVLSEKAVGYDMTEIDNWLETRKNASKPVH